MPFDSKAFKRAKLTPRTAEVLVPELSEWFGEDTPVWIVRAQTGEEYSKMIQAVANRKNLETVTKALLDANGQLDELKNVIRGYKERPADLVMRIERIIQASVSPEVDNEIIAKLTEYYPNVLYRLSDEITKLTGKGAVNVKKSSISGESQSLEMS